MWTLLCTVNYVENITHFIYYYEVKDLNVGALFFYSWCTTFQIVFVLGYVIHARHVGYIPTFFYLLFVDTCTWRAMATVFYIVSIIFKHCLSAINNKVTTGKSL